MGTELMNVEGFKGGPARAFAAVPREGSLADGIGQSYGVIRYKGKVWSVVHRGVRKNVVRPDDGTPSSYLDVIILSAADHKSKSYYKAFDQGSEGERPICASMDGLVPDLDVVQKQSDTCALCPHNEWKVQANGKKGRDCADYKRLAVVMLPAVTKALFGEPIMEAFFLRIPAASLNGLAQMGEQMDARGYPYFSYITRITFDPNEAHPKMVFTALQELTDAEAPFILKLRNDPQTGRIINGDISLPALGAPAGQQVIEGGAQRPLDVTSTFVAQTASQAPAPFSASVASAPPATTAAPLASDASAAASASTHVDTGFGGATPVSTTGGTSPVPTTGGTPSFTVSDTGVPQEADKALDERINNLLKTKATS